MNPFYRLKLSVQNVRMLPSEPFYWVAEIPALDTWNAQLPADLNLHIKIKIVSGQAPNEHYTSSSNRGQLMLSVRNIVANGV